MSRATLKEELIETDSDFRGLFDQHQSYEKQLQALQENVWPSQDDEVEIKTIKLRKLELKDRMEAFMVEHERSAVATA